ncbi:MAG TPA: hypothetical protein VN851_03815 [Thermoanaerobaculia bacterium]|nr:hypothetical protein [Thermoanaerobaculia bacterium]
MLWLIGSGALFLIFIIQSIGQKYGARVQDAWGWLLPTIMPTLSLMVGVLVSNAGMPQPKTGKSDRFIFFLALGFSFAYLTAVISTVLVQPFVKGNPLDLFRMSSLWLGPLQGLVAAVLGVFFIKAERSANN